MEVRVYEIKKEEDLSPLKTVWNALETGSEMTAFQTYGWHRLLIREWYGWKLHGLYSRVIIYVAYAEEQPVMIFPAILYKFSTKTKWFGAPKGVYLLGQGSYSDYMNVIFSRFSPEAFEAILAEIKGMFPGCQVCVSSIREDAALARYLKEKNAPCRESAVSLTVKKRESAEEYRASLSKKTRANLRQAQRRMERDGISYRIEITGPVKDRGLLDEMVRIHVRRILIKNKKDSGALHILSSYVRKSYRKYRDLHNNIVAMSMAENEASCVVLVWINETLAGYEYALREAHALRLLQTCFDETYKFYSPLFRAIYDFILLCHEEEHIREIDFLRGDEDYKKSLGGEEIMLYEFDL